MSEQAIKIIDMWIQKYQISEEDVKELETELNKTPYTEEFETAEKEEVPEEK